MSFIIPREKIEKRIYLLRGVKVMFDTDLAELYGVETRTLKQAVKRNIKRFPKDFMFKITKKERDEVITICDNLEKLKFYPGMPHVFTEQGIAMLSSVLNSERAIAVNIQIIRAFSKLRELAFSTKEVKAKLSLLEKKVGKHDEDISLLLRAIQNLVEKPVKEKRRIGF